MISTETEITGRVLGLLVVCEEHEAITHVSLLSGNAQLNIPIKNTPHDEAWWCDQIGRKVQIIQSTKVGLIGRTAADVCPDKIGKYLIQVTKLLPYERALSHAVAIKNCKLWKVTSDKYMAVRMVEAHDNVDIIKLSNGDWQGELIDVG